VYAASPVSRIVRSGGGSRILEAEVYDAKQEATAIVAAARAAADGIREQAREDGLDAGRAEAAALLVRARAVADQRIADAEADLGALAVRIAERVLRRQLALSPDDVAAIARAALDEARGRHDFTLRVHPDDVAVVERHRTALGAGLAASAHIAVRADDTVARGGCVVDSELGTVDLRLETQLAAIERALHDARRRGPA
jgi:flagellar biosynthesis/type III secretory pathway protein FliH